MPQIHSENVVSVGGKATLQIRRMLFCWKHITNCRSLSCEFPFQPGASILWGKAQKKTKMEKYGAPYSP